MAVRINSIHTPREEMAEIRQDIECEKETRRSLRISANEDYFKNQLEFLDQQIAFFQAKRAILIQRREKAPALLEESLQRSAKLEKRYFALQNREKLDKIEELAKTIEALRLEIGE